MSLDHLEARDMPSPEDIVLELDDVTRTAEALAMLKPQEVTALWMRASGRAYKEIATELDWTYTKVNRCIAEGRKAFLQHFEAIDSGAACEQWAPALSAVFDGEAGTRERLQLRRHLRNCPGCRATALSLHRSRAPLAVVLPGLLVAEPVAAADSSSFLVRFYEAAAHFATERTAASTVKVQALVDAASMTKVTAVAASAAALAGGGAATVKDVVAPAAQARPTQQPAKQERATAAPQRRIVALARTGTGTVPRPSGTRAASQAPAAAIVAAGRRERRLKATSRAKARAAARRPRTPAAQASAEFTGLPASGPAARRTAAAPSHTPPATSPPSASGTSFERSTAAPTTSSSTSSAAAAREFAP